MEIKERVNCLLNFLNMLLELKTSGKNYYGAIENTIITLNKLLN